MAYLKKLKSFCYKRTFDPVVKISQVENRGLISLLNETIWTLIVIRTNNGTCITIFVIIVCVSHHQTEKTIGLGHSHTQTYSYNTKMTSTTQEEKTINQATDEDQKENSASENGEKPKNKKYRKDKRKSFVFCWTINNSKLISNY
jgi:uncharacterized membrane protein YhiD involved in acid resistance